MVKTLKLIDACDGIERRGECMRVESEGER